MINNIGKELAEFIMRYKNEFNTLPNLIYHYTDIETTKKILMPNNITLKLTNINDFYDKCEGKVIDVYYDMALLRLKKENVIDDTIYNKLINIETDSKNLFVEKTDLLIENYIAYTNQADNYVVCFSEKQNDDYMINKYIKSEDKKGFCIEFSSRHLSKICKSKFSTNNKLDTGNFDCRCQKVLYGEEIIDYIYNFIKELVSIFNKFDQLFLDKLGIGIIKHELHNLQYRVKREKYRIENEVRLVLSIPKRKHKEDYNLEFIEINQQVNKKFVLLKLPKNNLLNLYKTKNINTDELCEFQEFLKENTYTTKIKNQELR